VFPLSICLEFTKILLFFCVEVHDSVGMLGKRPEVFYLILFSVITYLCVSLPCICDRC